ncbi:MAG: DUF2512 family protein [Firmicutes bacterium]|nr:DUF2512 family protein [Bacillota bacterium]
MQLSRTVTALIVRFLLTLVAAWIAFSWVGFNPLDQIVLLAVVGTIVNYVLGDLMVLPRYGNLVASVGDGVLAAVVAYLVDLFLPAFRTNFLSLVLFGVLVAIAEYVFHQYLFRAREVSP